MSEMVFAQPNDTLEEAAIALATYLQRRGRVPTYLLLDVQTHKELLATLPEGVDVAGAFGVTEVKVFRFLAKRQIIFASTDSDLPKGA